MLTALFFNVYLLLIQRWLLYVRVLVSTKHTPESAIKILTVLKSYILKGLLLSKVHFSPPPPFFFFRIWGSLLFDTLPSCKAYLLTVHWFWKKKFKNPQESISKGQKERVFLSSKAALNPLCSWIWRASIQVTRIWVVMENSYSLFSSYIFI